MIDPAAYRLPESLRDERQRLFARAWVFAGMLYELDGGAHLGVEVAGVELLLQRDRAGRPRAFRNVCSHRHAQLCTRGVHQRPVRCPYHGWVYDREGVPVGIPQPQAFPAVVADPTAHRLGEYACEAAGHFVFVRIAGEGPSLREHLDTEFDFLVKASEGMTGNLSEFAEEVPANWKVLIENSLEGYHVPAVHHQTFMQVDGMQSGIDAARNFFVEPLHSYIEHPAEPAWLKRFARSMEPRIGAWAWRFGHYTHNHVFPNLTVTSFMGYSFHVQVFSPVDAVRTRVHSRTVGVGFTGQDSYGEKFIAKIHADNHAFTRQVFDEDGAICTRVQAGLMQAERRAVFGEGIEDRVRYFHRAYLGFLGALA